MERVEAEVLGRLSTLDRFLPVWIGIAMAVGLALGRAVPGLNEALDAVRIGQTSLPIAVGMLVCLGLGALVGFVNGVLVGIVIGYVAGTRLSQAFAQAPVTLDETYTTADESHAMMEPHATIAAWDGDRLTLWTSNQMIAWAKGSIAKILGIPKQNVRVDSPYVGGGFGGKLFVRADAVLAALAAKAAGRPVKVALTRPLIPNNTTHRPATIQRVRIGATPDGTITAIAHESVSGNLPDGGPETAVDQTKLLYAGANRLTAGSAIYKQPEPGAAYQALVEQVRAAGKESEAIGTLGQSRPSVKTMFEDVYSTEDWRLVEQRREVGV